MGCFDVGISGMVTEDLIIKMSSLFLSLVFALTAIACLYKLLIVSSTSLVVGQYLLHVVGFAFQSGECWHSRLV